MNIGLFTDTYFPQLNGVAASTATLAEQLRAKGHTVYIFAPTMPGASDNDPFVIRMPSMPCGFIQNYRVGLVYPPHVIRKIVSLHLDIIHTQTEFSLGMFAKSLSKICAIPMIHTYHTMYEDYVHYFVNGALVTKSMAHKFSRLFCNFASHVIAPTEKVRQSLLEYGVTKPIHVIPTGIRLERFAVGRFSKEEIAAARAEFGLDEDTFVILVLGRMTKEKSIDVILRAMPEVFSQAPNARLLFVGDGQYRPALMALTEELGIQDKVIFGGFRPWEKIGLYYQVGNLFVSASQSETQGLTFVEAMAAGLPVVARNDECIRGVVEDGVTGVLFDKEEDLPQKLLSLIQNPQQCQALRQAGLQKSATLSAETFGHRVEALYLSVMADWNAHFVRADYAEHLAHIRHKHHKLLRLAAYELERLKHNQKQIKKLVRLPLKKPLSFTTENRRENDDCR